MFRVMQYYQPLENLVKKIAGADGYYKLNPMPGDWGHYVHYIIGLSEAEDCFVLSDWKDFDSKRYPGVKHIENKSRGIKFLYNRLEDDSEDSKSWDDDTYDSWEYCKDKLKRESITLYNEGRLYAYIKLSETEDGEGREYNFDFKPVKNLFNKKR